MKKALRIFWILALVGSLFGTIYWLYSREEKKPERYAVEYARHTDIVRKTVATGTVVPRKEVLIKSMVSGIIEKIMVTAGKPIQKGDIIARIRIVPDLVSVNEAENRVKRARIQLENAQLDFDRLNKLYQQEVIPKTEWIVGDIALKNARQELEAAESNVQLIREGISKSMGDATNTLIRSTLSGLILDIPVKEGNSVIQANNFNEGTTIASIADMGKMVFEGKVDEAEVGRLKPGMGLSISVGAIPGKTFGANLEYIAPKGVSENGTIQFQIKAAMELDKNFFLRSNYSANADIVLEEVKNVLAVNESLVSYSGDSAYVMVEAEKSKYKKQFVKLGLSDGIHARVLDGITEKTKLRGALITE
jgi:HlyD family secretion protein